MSSHCSDEDCVQCRELNTIVDSVHDAPSKLLDIILQHNPATLPAQEYCQLLYSKPVSKYAYLLLAVVTHYKKREVHDSDVVKQNNSAADRERRNKLKLEVAPLLDQFAVPSRYLKPLMVLAFCLTQYVQIRTPLFSINNINILSALGGHCEIILQKVSLQDEQEFYIVGLVAAAASEDHHKDYKSVLNELNSMMQPF